MLLMMKMKKNDFLLSDKSGLRLRVQAFFTVATIEYTGYLIINHFSEWRGEKYGHYLEPWTSIDHAIPFVPFFVIPYLLLIALVGTISFAFAKNFTGLFISRIFIGVGVSACLMGPLTGYRVWFEEKYQQRANSWMLMVLSIGFLASTLPVQILLPLIGWRSIFFLIGALILLSIILLNKGLNK